MASSADSVVCAPVNILYLFRKLMNRSTQLLGVSNAIVDILAHVEHEFLDELGAEPGSMTLIDAERAQQVYQMMGPATEMSGGSVGNSVANFARLGGQAAYIGRVAEDQFGAVFEHDMSSLGVDMRLPPETRNAPTALSYVLITPDGQRTMQTYLGACTELAVSDITEDTVGEPGIVLIEGYLLDTPQGPEVVSRVMQLARKVGANIAISLSDSGCVERHHQRFLDAVYGEAGIIVANEKEITTLMATTSFDAAVKKASGISAVFALTRSEKGSVVVYGDQVHVEPAAPIKKLVDSTGAGDAYTAGFLYGLINGRPLSACAQLGSACAAIVIQQIGARLEQDTRLEA